MSLVLTPATIALCVCVPAAGLLPREEVVRQGHRDRESPARAAKLAAKLQEIGLRKLPEFLIDYSVGDYSGMANKIHMLAELFLGGDDPVLAEVDTVFRNVLTRNSRPRKAVHLLQPSWLRQRRLPRPSWLPLPVAAAVAAANAIPRWSFSWFWQVVSNHVSLAHLSLPSMRLGASPVNAISRCLPRSAREFPVTEVDFDAARNRGSYHVSVLPTYIVLSDGREVMRTMDLRMALQALRSLDQ